jgi:polar amino acid transport system substrate-binding protein
MTSLFCRLLSVFLLLFVLPVISSGQELDDDRPVIVGGDRDYPPYEFIDRNGVPAGFNVDLSRAIAGVMGLKVEFRMGGWKEMRDALQAGRVDILQGISFSDQRTRTVDFSPPHSIVSHAIFARRDSPPVRTLDDLKGKEVIVFQSGIMHDLLEQKGIAGRLILTATPADALRLLASGKHDYAVVAALPGIYLIRELKLTNLVPVATGIAFYPYCYAVKKGDDELLSRFSEGLAILKKTGEYQRIHDRWLGVLEPQPVSWREAARYAAVVVIPLILVLCGTVLWSRSLRRQVAIRTDSLAREVTERERAVEELRRNQAQLVQADKMKSLGTLVSGVAHEVNNPTGLILLSLPTIQEAWRDAEEVLEERYREQGDFQMGGLPYSRMRDEVPRMLEETLDGARRIKRIVEELKDFARKDDTAVQTVLDFNGVAKASVRLVERAIRAATTGFEASYADNLPKIKGNQQRIEQVVVNLIINACQALPNPERGIFLETRFNRGTGCVELDVRDEGVGIPPENLDSLTDPFFTTRRESGGTGLGLSVSAGIVKEHGGTLTFQSQPGAGTVVTLALPSAEETPA